MLKYLKKYWFWYLLAPLFMVGEIAMDQGRVVEMGNHEELLERQGYYYKLYMTQFAGKET